MSIKSKARMQSRLESERTLVVSPVHIQSISEDGHLAYVRIMGNTDDRNMSNPIEVKITGFPPGYTGPINVSNYTGILLGDVKAPLGLLLVEKVKVEPNIRHGLSKALHGQQDGRPIRPIDRAHKEEPKTTTQKINRDNTPSGQMIVVKPPKQVPIDYMDNPYLPPNPADIIDMPGAYVAVGEDEARLVGDTQNGIIVSGRNGVSIGGPVQFSASMQDVRFGGAWRVNPMQQYQIPSSVITPIPTMVCDFPGKEVLSNMKDYMSSLKA